MPGGMWGARAPERSSKLGDGVTEVSGGGVCEPESSGAEARVRTWVSGGREQAGGGGVKELARARAQRRGGPRVQGARWCACVRG